MRKYLKYLAIAFRAESYYKQNLIASVLTTLFFMLIQVQLWRAVYGGQQSIGGISFAAMIAYVSLGTVFRRMLGSGIDHTISSDFRKGTIAISLARPESYPIKVAFSDMGKSLVSTIILLVPVCLIFILFQSVRSVISIERVLQFALSGLLSMALYFCISFVVGISSAWLGNSIAFAILKDSLMSLLGGILIPLDLYPRWLQSIVNILPFKQVYYSPLSFFLKPVGTFEAFLTFGLQLVWLAVFFVIGLYLYNKARTRAVIQGG